MSLFTKEEYAKMDKEKLELALEIRKEHNKEDIDIDYFINENSENNFMIDEPLDNLLYQLNLRKNLFVYRKDVMEAKYGTALDRANECIKIATTLERLDKLISKTKAEVVLKYQLNDEGRK